MLLGHVAVCKDPKAYGGTYNVDGVILCECILTEEWNL